MPSTAEAATNSFRERQHPDKELLIRFQLGNIPRQMDD